VCVGEEGNMAPIELVVSNSTSATAAEVIIPEGQILENLNNVIGFSHRFRSLWDEIDMWRQPIKDLKGAFGVRMGCAGKRMMIGETTYNWEEFCRHYFNLSVRRVNELLEEPLVEITDDDLPESGDNHDEDGESGETEEEQEGEAEEEEQEEEEEKTTARKGRARSSKQKRVHRPTANRAILADFTKLILPILLNAPTDTTKEEIHDKAREQAILFAENYPELVAELRLPAGFNLKPRIAELEEEIDRLKAEHEVAKQKIVENFRQRIESLSKVPDNLKDDHIAASLAAEPDTDAAGEMLTAYLRTVVERVLPPEMEMRQPKPFKVHEADGHVTATVAIKGRDCRIMIGDYLEKKGVKEDAPTLAKCTAVGECEQRRRVREWDGSKWGKEHVVYWGRETGEEKSYKVISEARAREIAPAAFGSAEPSAAEVSPVVNPAPQESEEPTV
jgi:uncharacterized small protein (DUF1192 family)